MQYIFSHISDKAIEARKYNMRERNEILLDKWSKLLDACTFDGTKIPYKTQCVKI